MSKQQTGIKSTLISEILGISYCIGATLVNKYFFKGSSIEYLPVIIWVLAVGAQWVYNKKYDDLIDEASKCILSRVNDIAIKLLFFFCSYSIYISCNSGRKCVKFKYRNVFISHFAYSVLVEVNSIYIF
ncbi:TPA: hypothetical protein ACMV83_003481 [Clostridioides difficile]